MTVTILEGDAGERLRTMESDSVNSFVSSPPYYGLRSYLPTAHPLKQFELGLEETPDEYVAALAGVFREARRVLRSDGTFWLNLGDSYAGSGKGGNPIAGKQATNKGSQSVGTLYGTGMTAREAAVSNVTRKTFDGIKAKDLIGIPWRAAFALQADGWYLRDAIVWAKPNGMPGSQEDRCTSSYEMIFLFSKSRTYWSDFDAIKTPPRESTMVRTAQDVQAQAGSHRANGGGKTNGPMKAVGGRDKQRGHGRQHAGFNERWDAMERSQQQAQPATMRNVWFVPPANYAEAHFAVMPEEIARRCILAGCPQGGIVCDPYFGSGTVGLVADRLGRDCVGIELNPEYANLARDRIKGDSPLFAEVSMGIAGVGGER